MRAATIIIGLVVAGQSVSAFAQSRPQGRPQDPGAYVHDGFYLRGSIGPSFHHTRIDTNRAIDPAATASGAAVAGEVMIGGAPIPGLVIGGALMGDLAPNPKVTMGGREMAGDFVESSTGLVAAFIDGYPDPRSGLHFGGAAGFLGNTLDDKNDPTDQEETHEGVGGAVWCGYDVWIAPQWSVGGMIRLSGGTGKHDVMRDGVGVSERATTWSLGVLFAALYN